MKAIRIILQFIPSIFLLFTVSGCLTGPEAGEPAAPSQPRGMIAYYPLTGDTKDQIGKRDLINYMPQVGFKDFRGKTGAYFDGIRYFEIPDIAGLNANNVQSVSFWMMVQLKPGVVWTSVFWEGVTGETCCADRRHTLWIHADRFLYNPATPRDANNERVIRSPPGIIQDDTFYHVVSVLAPETERFLLYLNGNEVAINNSWGKHLRSATHFYLGLDGGNNSVQFHGIVGEFAVWDRPLSAMEVKALYENSRPR